MKSLQCAFFLRKKPLRGRAVGYSYSGSAVTTMTVMGRDEFDLDLTGKLEGNMLKVAGNIPWGGATVDCNTY